MNLLKEITQEDLTNLSEEQKQLLEIVGLDAFKKLVQTYGGSLVYIPQMQTLEVSLRNKKIIQEFNGSNYRQLAVKYGITVTWVKQIIKQKDNIL